MACVFAEVNTFTGEPPAALRERYCGCRKWPVLQRLRRL